MSRKIIAFAGSKQAGKTTAFVTMRANFPEVHEITIAGKLKLVVGKVLGIDQDFFNKNELKEKYLDDPITVTQTHITQVIEAFGLTYDFDKHVRQHVNALLETPRQCLQFFGTNVLHKIDDLVHIKNAVKDMPETGLVIVTDLRFAQEFDYFQQNYSSQFFPFYIKNSKAEAIAASDTHPSETDLQKFKNKCALIDNNFTLEEYQFSIVKNIQAIL